MSWRTVRDLLPALLLHVAAAAVHAMSTVGLSGRPGPLYEGALALMALVVPMAALLALLSGMRRLGAALFLISYVGVAGLTLVGHLGLGHLVTALSSEPSPYRTAFFGSAMLMPLIQIHGIVEALRAWGLIAEPRRNRLLSK